MTRPGDTKLLREIAAALETGEPIRIDFGRGERLHIDRPMPFLCVHIGRRREPAARGIVQANSAYLLVSSVARAKPIIALIDRAMTDRFGAFILLDIGELPRDQLASDAAHLPPFEMTISATDGAATAASGALATAANAVQAKFRRPQIVQPALADDPFARLARAVRTTACVTLRFAPIYRVPESEAVYPELLDRLVANLVDAGLQAVAAFVQATGSLAIASHRSLGRKVFIDAVSRADRAMDEVAQSFDLLLAVTPINSVQAWEEFQGAGFKRVPHFLYRPLAFSVGQQKRKLFSLRLDQFEDPVLTNLYREKQQEVDLQLSLLAARETPRFVELGRALYGPVEPALVKAANAILAGTKAGRGARRDDGDDADHAYIERRARAMIKAYASGSQAFPAVVEVREDLPAGLLVTSGRLLISRDTRMARTRVEALLSHEVGVHLLTYFNGSAQGLRLFRSGLAGYEGVQEGLAVLAEYLVGGMTVGRMRLLAARVLGTADMLDGASFPECFARVRDLGLSSKSAFNLVLRIYRGGGLAKDAIYLRGLLEVLAHLGAGGSLEPFWMGKIAASHFGIMQELAARGLLKPAPFEPQFLSHPDAGRRLAAAAAGMSPIDLVT